MKYTHLSVNWNDQVFFFGYLACVFSMRVCHKRRPTVALVDMWRLNKVLPNTVTHAGPNVDIVITDQVFRSHQSYFACLKY